MPAFTKYACFVVDNYQGRTTFKEPGSRLEPRKMPFTSPRSRVRLPFLYLCGRFEIECDFFRLGLLCVSADELPACFFFPAYLELGTDSRLTEGNRHPQ